MNGLFEVQMTENRRVWKDAQLQILNSFTRRVYRVVGVILLFLIAYSLGGLLIHGEMPLRIGSFLSYCA